MSPRAVALLFDNRRERVGRIALVALAAFVVFWVVDAALDVLFWHAGGWSDELFDPGASEVWMRTVVALLIAALFIILRQGARLRLLFSAIDEAADGVQISDLAGHVVYSNRAVRDIYGFEPEELRGRHVNSMNVDPDFASRVILPSIRETGRWAGELEVKHKDGRTFPIWLTTALVFGSGKRPMAAVGIIRDITKRRRTEEQLRTYAKQLEDATQLKDLFADILRHDLLGPAGALQMSVDVLARREADPATVRLVEQMRRSCARLTELIEHAAKYAKISTLEQLDLQTLDLRTLLQDSIAELEVALRDRAPDIQLVAGGPLPVRANPLVREVFSNLISNAIKYGPDHGTVTVDVQDAGDEWVIAVSDRGEGILEQDKERIFTRFERLKREGVKGSGLGLAIAKRTVELHRGRIWVEDNPGGGSVFRVALPKAPAASAGA